MNRDVYYKYFNEYIKTAILPLEKQRRKLVVRLILSTIIMLICGILCAYIYIAVAVKNNLSILLLPVVLFFMYVFFIKSITNVIEKGKEYQNKLMQNVLPYFMPPVANFKYWYKNKDIGTFLDSQLFYNFEDREDDWSIFGIYKNVNITINDTKLTIPVNKTVFKGVVIQIEFNKSIDNHAILISKNEPKLNDYPQINPHINELNEYLYTFALNNNTEFITESFWQIIKHIGEVYTAKSFMLSYNNNTLLIALRRKRPLRFGFILKPLNKPESYNDLIDMFLCIYDLIDELNQ